MSTLQQARTVHCLAKVGGLGGEFVGLGVHKWVLGVWGLVVWGFGGLGVWWFGGLVVWGFGGFFHPNHPFP